MKNRMGKNQWFHRHATSLRVCGLLAFIAILATAAGGASAKYIHKTETKATATAEEFYFKSDLLDGETHTVSALESDGTASVTFALQNHADELRYTGVEISYTVKVEKKGDNGTVSDGVTVSPSQGTIAGGEKRDENITVSGLQAGESYTVTATSTSPYAETLTGTIQVTTSDLEVHSETDKKDQYIEVTVWTVDYSGQVTMTYPAGWIPDNTDSMMEDWKTGTETQNRTFNMKANSSHVFRFFKGTTYSDESGVTVSAAQ